MKQFFAWVASACKWVWSGIWSFLVRLWFFLVSIYKRAQRETPKFWKWLGNTGLAITTVCGAFYVPDIPLVGDAFHYELSPRMSEILSHLMTWGIGMKAISKLAATDTPPEDKKLEK